MSRTEILRVRLPKGPNGEKDINDWRHNPEVILQAIADAELIKVIEHGAAADDGSIWGSPLDLSGLATIAPVPPTWFVRERIQQGRGVLLTGLGGSSKTRLVYQLAIGAALGELPWDWQIDTTGPSVLVLTEDTAEDVYRTLHCTCRALGLSPDEIKTVSELVTCYPLAGVDVLLLASDGGRALTKTPHFENLVTKVRDRGAVFVAIDPALAVTTGDETDQGHQRALGKMADDLAVRTGAAVALVAHATKASLNTDELQSHNSRGGGAVTDVVRGEFAMRTMTLKEAAAAGIRDNIERKRHVQLVGTKGNHLPPEAYGQLWLRRGDCGTLFQVQVNFDGGGNSGGGLSGKDVALANLLADMCRSHVPQLHEWREEAERRGLIHGPTKEAREKNLKRAKDRLVAAGLIERGMRAGSYVPISDFPE